MHIILASRSPRRLHLLQSLGFTVTVIDPNVEESPLTGESPIDMVQRLASVKARSLENESEHPIIAADTIVCFKTQILGKPADPIDAFGMLSLLSGEEHQVITGYVVKNKTKEKVGYTTTLVSFRELSKDQILSYIATDEPLDKAGAYAIQGKGACLINQIQGSYTNVIGLPLPDVLQALNQVLN